MPAHTSFSRGRRALSPFNSPLEEKAEGAITEVGGLSDTGMQPGQESWGGRGLQLGSTWKESKARSQSSQFELKGGMRLSVTLTNPMQG